jgi:hypothetical protein
MLPSDVPFLETALALLALPIRPIKPGVLSLPALRQKLVEWVMPDAQ